MTFWYKLHKMMMDLSSVFFPYHISGCAYLTLYEVIMSEKQTYMYV